MYLKNYIYMKKNLNKRQMELHCVKCSEVADNIEIKKNNPHFYCKHCGFRKQRGNLLKEMDYLLRV